MTLPTVERLLPNTSATPIWRRAGIRSLESQCQAASQLPLMDLAGLATARLARAVAPHARCITVLAGPGNNGGDGLEAAMHLQMWGATVQVHLLAEPAHLPKDARRAFDRARQAGVTIHVGTAHMTALTPWDLAIDAVLGIGATREPEADMVQAIHWLNASPATVLAIDIPTGLDADSGQPLGQAGSVVRADHTLTMLGAKPGLFMGHGRDACGTLWLAPLDVVHGGAHGCAPEAELNPAPLPLQRHHASHKGSHGDVAIVGGESVPPHTGMTGAAVLAAQAALHGGAGRVMLSLLGQEPPALPPDLMRRDLDALDLPRLTVVAGCGGGHAITSAMGKLLLHSARLVLDADALNRLAEDPWLQGLLSRRASHRQMTVLTPHPLEAARLLDCDTARVQANRLETAKKLATQWECCVVLKGSGTVIAAPSHTPRINTTGNGLLATGGTGDVLAGLVGARLAHGLSDWQAACDAVWTHGQLASDWPSEQALTASRLAEKLN